MSSPKPGKSGLGLLLTAGGGENSPRFVPPMLKEVSKLAAGIASVSTSASATGNPRNKCVLKPGHSHIDWVRLTNSKDLTGLGPLAGKVQVTPEELAKHNKVSDGWLALQGKVFNVTSYVPFHPGGVEELKRGLGKDATKLFYDAHPWVNWDTILKKCYVGPLVSNQTQLEPPPWEEPKEPHPPIAIQGKTTAPRPRTPPEPSPIQPPSFHCDHEDPDMQLTTNTFYNRWLLSRVCDENYVPRFEWLQKSHSICIAFGCGCLANPLVEAKRESATVVTVWLRFPNKTVVNQVTLEGAVHWPCLLRVFEEVGKVELVFKKVEEVPWVNYGILKQEVEESSLDYRRVEYVVSSKKEVVPNMFLLELTRREDFVVYAPLGSHYRVLWPERRTSKRYTPIPPPNSLFSNNPNDAKVAYGGNKVHLLVKRYTDGRVSRYVCDTEEGAVLEMSMPFLGDLDLEKVRNKSRFLLISAGTGVTPMLSLMVFALQRETTYVTKLGMAMVHHSIKDIPFLDEFLAFDDGFTRLSKACDPPKESRFFLKFFVNDYDDSRNDARFEKKEEVMSSQIKKLGETFVTSDQRDDTFVFVCGSRDFNKMCHFALREACISISNFFLFEG